MASFSKLFREIFIEIWGGHCFALGVVLGSEIGNWDSRCVKWRLLFKKVKGFSIQEGDFPPPPPSSPHALSYHSVSLGLRFARRVSEETLFGVNVLGRIS